MKPIRYFALAAAAALTPSTGFAALAFIDDFSDGSLSEYTQTRILDNGVAEANVSFSSASGQLVASYSGTVSQAEQVSLLRSDYSLAVGERLIADVSQGTSSSSLDFGIMVSTTAIPTGAAAGSTDTRKGFEWAAVFVRPSDNTVRSQYYDGLIASISSANPTSAVLTADETTVAHLWIERIAENVFSLGYTNNLGEEFTSRTVTTFTDDGVGTAVGFYTDLRAPGATLGGLDNLRIIPEPASASLMGLALLLPLMRRRR